MNGQDIQKALAPYISDDILTINSQNKLGSTGLNTLLATFFGGTLSGKVGDPQVDSSSVTYTNIVLKTQGFALYQKLATVQGSIKFYEKDTAIACALTITLPDTYRFGDSFQSIATLPGSPLQQLYFNQPVYRLDTAFTTNTVQFQASVPTTNGLLNSLSWVFLETLTISGSITVTKTAKQTYQPEMQLLTNIIRSPAISGFELDILLQVTCAIFRSQQLQDTEHLLTDVTLITDLKTPSLNLPIAIPLFDAKQKRFSVILDITKPSPALSSLDSLSGFTGGNSPAKALSTDTPIGKLALDSVSLVFDAENKHISDLSIGIHLGTHWNIVNNVLKLDKLIAVFMIPNLYQPKQFSVKVVAEMSVISSVLDVFVQYPEKIVGVQLAYGSVIDINDFLHTFAQGINLPGKSDLKITMLDVLANIGRSTYSLSCEAAGSLSIIPNFVLNQLSFAVEYANSKLSSISIGCLFTIANAELYLSINKTESGWRLAGGTYQRQNILLGDLVVDLLSIFSIQLPTTLPKIVLSDLELTHYNTADSSLAFQGEVGYVNDSDPLLKKLQGKFSLSSAQGKWTGRIDGSLEIGTNIFTVAYDFQKDQILTCSWQAQGHETLGIIAICDALSISRPDLPEGLDLGLTSASITYDITSKELILTAASSHYGDAIFITKSIQQERVYAFGVSIPLHVTLADIPLVHGTLPEIDQLGIAAINAWILSRPLQKLEVELINPLIKSGYPTLPDQDITAKLSLQAMLLLGKDSLPLSVALGTTTQSVRAVKRTHREQALMLTGTVSSAVSAPAPADDTKWVNVEKTFGFFSFKRIGVQYQGGKLLVALDAAILLGPLTFSMDGLSVDSPLTQFTPHFHLSGLGLSYTKAPVEIMGAFLAIPDKQLAPNVAYQYDGLAVIGAEQYSFAAIGSYARLMNNGDPSLFVFAQVEGAFGGPPAFFITGIMAGFGYNRTLAIPAQDEVANFPLLALAAAPEPGKAAHSQDAATVLDILEGRQPLKPGEKPKAWITPESGQYWLAVGLEFTSFELVSTRAMLIAQFGDEFTLTLLGLSRMSLPRGSTADLTYAYVELQLKAIFQPQKGIFGLTAVLSNNSYVIAPASHLTGGFAFYVWFGNSPQSGQFVITLGGYHPAFSPPSYFPQEPRLGFNWSVSDQVTIKGDAYFALTTSCIMAGGGLEMLFHSGNLSAWFIAQADLLVSWQPFFFLATIDVSIGIMYKLDLGFVSKTLSLSIGASMHMWGPPTGGTVYVHLWVVSFSVAFGSQSATHANDPLSWTQFQTLLPPTTDVCKITAGTGLNKTLDDPEVKGKKIWLVRATGFTFSTEAAIPSSQIVYGKAEQRLTVDSISSEPLFDANDAVPTGFTVNIRPMNQKGITSTHSISIQNISEGSAVDVASWQPQLQYRNVPESLWGEPLLDTNGKFTQLPQQATASTVNNAPIGSQLQLPAPQYGPATGIIPLKELAYEPISSVDGQTPLEVSVSPSPDFLPAFNTTTVKDIEGIMDNAIKLSRDAIYQVLNGAKIYQGPNGTLDKLVQDAQHEFSDSPLLQM
jgi:hypothetical protein